MLHSLKLLLPALIPSWRFFDVIAPAPHIEFSLLKNIDDVACLWQEFRPRPVKLSIMEMLWRMLWNGRWNESLFLVSCAERLMQTNSQHSVNEIRKRIESELICNFTDTENTPYLQFRLVFLSMEKKELTSHITYISQPYLIRNS